MYLYLYNKNNNNNNNKGCGKSSLLRQLCAIIRAPLRTLNIHGGMEDNDIIEWMKLRLEECSTMRSMEKLVCFLDEINTCNSMGLLPQVSDFAYTTPLQPQEYSVPLNL